MYSVSQLPLRKPDVVSTVPLVLPRLLKYSKISIIFDQRYSKCTAAGFTDFTEVSMSKTELA